MSCASDSVSMHSSKSLWKRSGAYRQEWCREGIVDGSKHGDALVVSIQIELQSFALQAAHSMLLNLESSLSIWRGLRLRNRQEACWRAIL